MDTDQSPTVELYREARNLPGIKKVLVASGVRYDLAVEDPNYVKELVQHHVGGYLKIAPEHTEDGPLSKMMKPGMGAYDKFKEMFDRFSKEAGKEQYLIPYFIASHPGTTDLDMINLALWLKARDFRLDQVQNFYPSPMANATTIYHTEMNSLKNINKANTEVVPVPKGERQRRLHKAILRYHDPKGWPIIREALIRLKMQHLIGRGKDCLVPPETKDEQQQRPQRGGKPALTRHTGLNPAAQATAGSKHSTANGKAKGKAQAGQVASKPASQAPIKGKPAARGKPVVKGKPAAKTGRVGS
jgi:hypothetical protein